MSQLNNKNKYRGLAFLLAASLVVSSASIAVVSCGGAITLDKILQRRRDTTKLTLAYNTPVESWNTAHSQNQGDSEFLANLYAGALGIDEYGRTYGDVFTSGYADENGDSPYVGNPKPETKLTVAEDEGASTFDPSVWKYEIRDNAKWYKKDGSEIRNIKSSDFVNTAKYVLDKSKGSDLTMLWETFILNVKPVSALYSAYLDLPKENGLDEKLTGEELISAAWEKAIKAVEAKQDVAYKSKDSDGKVESRTINGDDISDGGFGLKTFADDDKKVEFHLSKPSTYFETVLTYGSFTPIFSANVDKLENGPIDAYSGAYLPDSIDGDNKKLVKNEKYHFASKTSIKEINWKYLANPSSSTARQMFEAGEIDAFGVKQTDEKGWSTYIGSNSLDPSFTGVFSTEPVEDFSFGIIYNFFNSAGSEGNKKATSASKVLQLTAARELLATGINRTDFVKYYSEKFDEPNTKVSKNIRNIYTSPNFAINPEGIDAKGEVIAKDYTEYVKEQVETITESKVKAADVNEGNDPLYENSENLNGKTRGQLVKEVRDFIDNETNKIQKTSDGKVELVWLLSPDNGPINPYLVSMFDRFNGITDNPLKINGVVTNTQQEWTKKMRAGEFDLMSSGWGPDYADPYSYLATYKIDGDYSAYSGTRRLTDTVAGKDKKEYNESLAKDSPVYSTATKEFYETLSKYDEAVEQIDLGETVSDDGVQTTENRYKAFAQQEVNLIYKDFLMTPFYNRNQYKEYKVSYVKPYTYGNAIFGLSSGRLFTQQKSSSIATKEEYVYQIEQYKLVKEAIAARPSTGKSSNIFYQAKKNN
ncbi:hypothetical protein CXP39_01085 [Mesoplasma syrphidae]|uniref:Solute-binding protein family 5 domain-containing protein n=1 Tax=Mesoplasma syrphidae TaxID=225999 RepID=A0A2K9C1P4_9MOLU|nr:ABC transporter substrate-binding protein [Mesoplasma syrphidae]AUF83399.1 hypothetical protein CXP39_01085 [Mesoplasma syrphidae]